MHELRAWDGRLIDYYVKMLGINDPPRSNKANVPLPMKQINERREINLNYMTLRIINLRI